MKKLIYTIGFLMMATIVVRPIVALYTANAQSDGASESASLSSGRFWSQLLPAGMSNNWFESTGNQDESKLGEDLYFKVLKKTVVNPQAEAVKNTAGKYGMTENDLEFIRQGSFQSILAKKPSLSQEDAIRKMAEIQSKFAQEASTLKMKASIEAATTPSEIFANGDISDSGFDLINDLELIEKLLFLKTDPIDIGKMYNRSSTGQSAGGPSGGGGASSPQSATGTTAGSQGNQSAAVGGGTSTTPASSTSSPQASVTSTTDTSSTSSAEQTNPSSPTPAGQPASSAPQQNQPTSSQGSPQSQNPQSPQPKPEKLNPNACFADNTLKKAIDDYEKGNPPPGGAASQVNSASSGNGEDRTAGGTASGGTTGQNIDCSQNINKNLPQCTNPGNATSGQSGQNNGDNGTENTGSPVAGANNGAGNGQASSAISPSSSASQSEDFMPEITLPSTPPVQPAPADDWKKNQICVGTFCLFINKYYDTPTSKYQDPDNCINCHIEKINDQMKKVLSHSLSPNKIPGNLIETPKCKNGLSGSLGAISMNVNVQFMPIKTPPNDELIFGSDSANDWKYFCDATAFFPAETCKTDPEPARIREEEPPNVSDTVTKRELSMISEGTPMSVIQDRISAEINRVNTDQAEKVEEIQAEQTGNPNIIMFKALIQEIDKMNYTFNNIMAIIQSLHEKVEGVAGGNACVDFKNKKTCT